MSEILKNFCLAILGSAFALAVIWVILYHFSEAYGAFRIIINNYS